LDTAVRFQRVSEWVGPDDGVHVAASAALAPEDSCFLQVAHDPLHGTFGDADLDGNLTQGSFWALNQAD